MTDRGITRRRALAGAATVGIGLPVLAACGGGSGSGGSGPSTKPGQALGPAADVPVGGGQIYGDEQIAVTQPAKGEFKGFSAVCTHQGCLLASVSDGTLNCDCHGSKFSIEDGSVVDGPAGSALPAVDVTDKSGTITTV